MIEKPTFSRFGIHFGSQKVTQNEGFFETWKSWFGYGIRSKSETWGGLEIDTNRVGNKLKKQQNCPKWTSNGEPAGGRTNSVLFSLGDPWDPAGIPKDDPWLNFTDLGILRASRWSPEGDFYRFRVRLGIILVSFLLIFASFWHPSISCILRIWGKCAHG